MNDYERVAEVIRYLDAHHLEQPGLEVLARVAGLSEGHFHRLFSRWAGVTPKDFLQCLTAEFARERLRQATGWHGSRLDRRRHPGAETDSLRITRATSISWPKSVSTTFDYRWNGPDLNPLLVNMTAARSNGTARFCVPGETWGSTCG